MRNSPKFELEKVTRCLPGGFSFAVLLVVLTCSISANAQELEPRTYNNTPTDINLFTVGYAHSSGNVLLDPALPIEDLDGKISVNHAGSYNQLIQQRFNPPALGNPTIYPLTRAQYNQVHLALGAFGHGGGVGPGWSHRAAHGPGGGIARPAPGGALGHRPGSRPVRSAF